MLTTLLAAAILATPAATPPNPRSRITKRLESYILKRQPKAKAYAARLARSIIVQSKRVGLDPAALAAVGWVESHYQTHVVGPAGSEGLFQLRRADARMAASWARLRPTAPPWRSLSREAVTAALRDVEISAYLAADELAGVRSWCRRAGHRIGRRHGPWTRLLGGVGVYRIQAQKHRYAIDRLGHHQTGPRWPQQDYLRALRYTYWQIRKVLRGR